MSISPNLSNSPKLFIAMSKVIEELKSGVPMSIGELSRKLGIDRRTVGRIVDILLDVQETLVTREIKTKRVGRKFLISFNHRTERARRILQSAHDVARRRTSFTILKRKKK
jgi:predicted transcriptional regulator